MKSLAQCNLNNEELLLQFEGTSSQNYLAIHTYIDLVPNIKLVR